MAGADYYNCDNCGAGKRFYDSNVDWESFGERIGQIRLICNECYDNGNRITLNKKDFPSTHNTYAHSETREIKSR